MKQYNVHEARTHLSKLLERVAARSFTLYDVEVLPA